MQNRVFKLEITVENDAFKEREELELSNILKRLSDRLEHEILFPKTMQHNPRSLFDRSLFDSQGNCVGFTKFVNRRET
jgi:hypothetical protein